MGLYTYLVELAEFWFEQPETFGEVKFWCTGTGGGVLLFLAGPWPGLKLLFKGDIFDQVGMFGGAWCFGTGEFFSGVVF